MKEITGEQLMTLPLGSMIKVVWVNSELHNKNELHYGVIFGDKIGYDDGKVNEIKDMAEYMHNGFCKCYFVKV